MRHSIYAFTFLFFLSQIANATKFVNEGVWISNNDKSLIQSMLKHPEFTIDHVTSQGFELYGPKGLKAWLNKSNVVYQNLTTLSEAQLESYPTPEEIERELVLLNKYYSNITELIKIGTSIEGRNLLVMKISNANTQSKPAPAFKYIANMHGDEIVGRELMVMLIKDLLMNYGTDSKITQLIDTTEIYIMPSMNPDGAAKARRGNAKYVDLNRDFPDFTTDDNKNTLEGRQPETKAIMEFQRIKNFKLSANFHGGAEVVNYPWDTSPSTHPEFNFVKGISFNYASQVDYMKTSTEFKDGITNGYDWYEVDGGMQDWSYYWHNDLQITIELSNLKWPNYSMINTYYSANRQALIDLIGKVKN